MAKQDKEELLKTAGVCGLYCKACSAFIGTNDDPERLKRLAIRSGKSPEDMVCKGCRSNTLSGYCKTCELRTCAKGKGIEFCSECNEYPCDNIKGFQSLLPHRIELFEALDYAKENEIEEWENKMQEDYCCKECGIINSAYDLKCRGCGTSPGNNFVMRNKEAILKVLTRK